MASYLKVKIQQILHFTVDIFLYDIILFIRRFYMPTSEARKRACKKYEQEKIDRIPLRVPRGKKLRYRNVQHR